MGIWDFISLSTDSVKGLWRSSYDRGSAAMTKVNKVVTVDAVEKVNQHWSDPESRSKISRVATDVAKNASIVGLKAIPGAYPLYKIASKSLSDDKKSKNENKSKGLEEDLKTLQVTVSRLEKEVGVLREQAAIQKQAVELKAQNTVQASDKTESRSEKEVGLLREQAAIQKQAVELKPQNTVQASEKTESRPEKEVGVLREKTERVVFSTKNIIRSHL